MHIHLRMGKIDNQMCMHLGNEMCVHIEKLVNELGLLLSFPKKSECRIAFFSFSSFLLYDQAVLLLSFKKKKDCILFWTEGL